MSADPLLLVTPSELLQVALPPTFPDTPTPARARLTPIPPFTQLPAAQLESPIHALINGRDQKHPDELPPQ